MVAMVARKDIVHKEEGLPIIRKYLETYGHESDSPIDIDIVMDLLTLILSHSIFKFGDTWWVQEKGTAMGTPCACVYATLFFGWFERQFLLRKYWKNILFYKRAIDDVIIVWIPDKENTSAFENFKDDLNNQCALTWTSTKLAKSVDFLDLTITIAPVSYTHLTLPTI